MAPSRSTPQPPAPSRDDVLTAYRRDGLLTAARRVFGARGFEEATVDAIAAEAGVAKGTVYLYFPSKTAIYEAAFDQGIDALVERTGARMREAATPREAIRAFIEVRAAYFLEHPDFFRMYVADVGRQLCDRAPRTRLPEVDRAPRTRLPEVDRAPRTRLAEIDRAQATRVSDVGRAPNGRRPDLMSVQTRPLRDVFARAKKAGELRDVDPAAAALAVFDLTRGFVARRLLTRPRSTVAADVAFLTDLIWAGLRPSGTSAPSGPTA
ncbi:MAG: helix-turn-helix domain-containing protein [Vicinamibacterales bacterium]